VLTKFTFLYYLNLQLALKYADKYRSIKFRKNVDTLKAFNYVKILEHC